MFQLEIICHILPHKQTEFIQAVNDLCDRDLKQKTELYLSIYQDLFDKNCFCYLEEWDNRKNLDEHIQSERFEMLIGAMKVLGEIQSAEIHEFENAQQLEL